MGNVPAPDSRITRVQSLTEEQVSALNAYADNHQMYPSRFPRMGIHKIAKPSIYSLHSMYKQSVRERSALRQHLPKELVDQAVVEYFLEFPAGSGFLDLQTYWVNQRPSMRIVSWSLTGNENFYISEKMGTPYFEEMEKAILGQVVADQDKVEILDYENAAHWKGRHDIVRQSKVKPVQIEQGQGFNFSLNLAHEVRVSDKKQRWICLGLMMGAEDTGLNRSF